MAKLPYDLVADQLNERVGWGWSAAKAITHNSKAMGFAFN
jgi:hypothetical protein